MKRPLIGVLVGFGITVVGPSCGLLGTVVGLSQSFNTVSSTAPEAKAKTLADGISLSMTSTIVGLAMVPVGMTILLGSLWFWWKESAEGGGPPACCPPKADTPPQNGNPTPSTRDSKVPPP